MAFKKNQPPHPDHLENYLILVDSIKVIPLGLCNMFLERIVSPLFSLAVFSYLLIQVTVYIKLSVLCNYICNCLGIYSIIKESVLFGNICLLIPNRLLPITVGATRLEQSSLIAILRYCGHRSTPWLTTKPVVCTLASLYSPCI